MPLIDLLQAALRSSADKRRLLQEPKVLRDIMNDLKTRRWLFEQWRSSNDSNTVLSLITDMMKGSQSIWRGGAISVEIYDEAYSQTWLWFIENLSSYDPQQASFTTWFNNKLRWMIIDVSRQGQAGSTPGKSIPINNSWIDPPAPDADRWHDTVEEWLSLVQADTTLMMSRMQIAPHINCQLLLTAVLLELQNNQEFSWEKLAFTENIDPQALRRFCKRRCFPCFQAIFSN